MGNFERLSVLVIVVIIVLIVVIALVQLTEGNEATTPTNDVKETSLVNAPDGNGGSAAMDHGGVTIPTPVRAPVGPNPQGPPTKPLTANSWPRYMRTAATWSCCRTSSAHRPCGQH